MEGACEGVCAGCTYRCTAQETFCGLCDQPVSLAPHVFDTALTRRSHVDATSHFCITSAHELRVDTKMTCLHIDHMLKYRLQLHIDDDGHATGAATCKTYELPFWIRSKEEPLSRGSCLRLSDTSRDTSGSFCLTSTCVWHSTQLPVSSETSR